MVSGIVTISANSVHAPFPGRALIASLSALVPVAVHGLLADLSISAPRGIEGLDDAAAHAGCAVFEDADTGAALRRALTAARHDDVLLLALGRVPASGFHLELESLRQSGIRTCIMREEPSGFAARLFPSLSPVAMLVAPGGDISQMIDAGVYEIAAMKQIARKSSVLKAKATVIDGP